MDTKLERLLELLEECSGLFPDLDKLVINDPDNPEYIIITSTEYLEQMERELGLFDDFEEVEDIADQYLDISSNSKKGKVQ